TKVGGVVSTTVIVWLSVETLLQASIASQVRDAMRVPPHSAFVVPPTTPIVIFVPPLQPSKATGMSKSHGEPHSKLLFGTGAKTGGFVLLTVMVCAQVEVM